ncbi:nucleotide-diphospho-sugar transferase [Neocallimastix sp. 'constans']
MVNVNAFVTLLTSDSYIQGVVALAHSLHITHTKNELVCMVTKSVSQDIIESLEKPGDLYDKVILVDELDSKDQKNLELLGRPELGITFTKLNVWKLVQYNFVTFLDADTIVLKNIDSLFDQIKEVYNNGDVAFLAAPDVGWPDNFNSGVFVCKPDLQTYSDLINYSRTNGSYDGGDQGLLNRFFSKWNNTLNARLSFNYNVTPSAYYTYAPSFNEHQDSISVIHFIGNNKPWKSILKLIIMKMNIRMMIHLKLSQVI